jgi:drug/metabolite transporter (DMT)-like permease
MLIAFAVFAAGNIGLNYFNSWALSPHDIHDTPGLGKGDFAFPFFYTMFHAASSSGAALLMQMTCTKPKDGRLPYFGQLWDWKFQLLPIACLTVIANGLNNYSLTLVPLFINQVIKACAPAGTSIFEFALLGKVNSCPIYVCVLAIVGGSILAVSASFGDGGDSKEAHELLLGTICCLISLLAASLRPVLQKVVQSGGSGDGSRTPLIPSQALFWDQGVGFWIYLVIWLSDISGERQASLDYLSGHTNNPNSGWLGVGIIICGSTMAFTFNIALYYFILYTSALSSSVGSNAVKIFLIIITAITDNMLKPTTIGGAVIVIAAIIAYAYFGFMGGKKPPPAAAPGDDKSAPLTDTEKAGPPSETTPLTSQISSVASSLPLVIVGIVAACVAVIGAAVAIPIIILNSNDNSTDTSQQTAMHTAAMLKATMS